ncbi:MAG: AAA family ATPase, partial [Bacilli bacterium]|nr:AAA family ATPase [Bacilli bacterium]
LGSEYQLRLVKCFIEDQQFFINLYSIIDQNMFTDEQLRRIVALMKDRYALSETVPTYNDLDVLIRSKIADAIAVEQCLSMIVKMRNMVFDAIDLIEEEAEKFFKQQNLSKALNKASEIIKKGNANDYYAIEDLIKKALETNTKQDYGFRLYENIESDLSDDYRQTISTGCKELDESLFGGLGKGELGLIVSPMGVGKSSMTTGFAAAAATTKCELNNYQGFKVLHFFFEDKESAIRRKYYGYALDIDACELSKPEIRPMAIKQLNEDCETKRMLKNNIIAKRLSSGEVTASEIKNKIKQYISIGFKPDLVIIDYFECLKYEKSDFNSDEWSREGITMRKLEAICNDLNIAIWCPVQGTKGSIGVEIVGLQHAGGSVKKTQIGHIVLTLAQTDEQKVQGRLNVFIGKLRAAKIGRTSFKNVKFNNGTGKFDMSDLDDAENELNNSGITNTAQSIAKSVKQEYRKNYGK